MIAALGNYTCYSVPLKEREEVFTFLKANVYESTEALTDISIRKLKKLLRSVDVLVVKKHHRLVGVCVFSQVYGAIDLLHMYVVKEERFTQASQLINFYLLDVYAGGKDVLISTFDSSTFNSAIEMYGSKYRIKPQVVNVLRKRIGKSIKWDS